MQIVNQMWQGVIGVELMLSFVTYILFLSNISRNGVQRGDVSALLSALHSAQDLF